MEERTWTIGQVGDALSCSPQTIRNWLERLGRHFSNGATPPPGRPRAFSQEDLQALAAVSHWRTQGLNLDEIEERLAQGQHHAEDIPQPEVPIEAPRSKDAQLITQDMARQFRQLWQEAEGEKERLRLEVLEAREQAAYWRAKGERAEALETKLESARRRWLGRLLGL